VGEKKRGKRRAQLTASFSIEHLQLSWFEGGLRYVIDLPQYTVNVYEFSEKTQAVSSLGESHGGGSDGGRSRLWQKDYDHIQDIKDSQEANDRPAAQEAPTSSEKQEKFRWLDADAAEEFGSPTSEQVRETPKRRRRRPGSILPVHHALRPQRRRIRNTTNHTPTHL